MTDICKNIEKICIKNIRKRKPAKLPRKNRILSNLQAAET